MRQPPTDALPLFCKRKAWHCTAPNTTLKPPVILQTYFMHGRQFTSECTVDICIRSLNTWWVWMLQAWCLRTKRSSCQCGAKSRIWEMSLLFWIDSWLPRLTHTNIFFFVLKLKFATTRSSPADPMHLSHGHIQWTLASHANGIHFLNKLLPCYKLHRAPMFALLRRFAYILCH